jgi:hypothetical protein
MVLHRLFRMYISKEELYKENYDTWFIKKDMIKKMFVNAVSVIDDDLTDEMVDQNFDLFTKEEEVEEGKWFTFTQFFCLIALTAKVKFFPILGTEKLLSTSMKWLVEQGGLGDLSGISEDHEK